MRQRGNLNNIISNLIDERETLETVFVLVPVLIVVFVLGDVLVTATERERGSERGEMRQIRSVSRKRVLVDLNNDISNLVDKRETLEAVFVLVPVLILVFVLGDFLITANERERGSEGGVMKQRGSASRKRVLANLDNVISNLSDESVGPKKGASKTQQSRMTNLSNIGVPRKMLRPGSVQRIL